MLLSYKSSREPTTRVKMEAKAFLPWPNPWIFFGGVLRLNEFVWRIFKLLRGSF